MIGYRRCISLPILLLGLALPSMALAVESSSPGDDVSKERREFWKSLSPTQKQQIRQLHRLLKQLKPEERAKFYDHLQKVPPQRRARMIARARERVGWKIFRNKLRSEEQELRKERESRLPHELRHKLQDLPKEKRQELARERFLRRRDQILSQLPAETRQRLETLPVAEQMRQVREFRDRKLFRRVFKQRQPAQIVKNARSRELVALLALEPKPSFMDDAEWERWRQLKKEQRLRLVREISRRVAEARKREREAKKEERRLRRGSDR